MGLSELQDLINQSKYLLDNCEKPDAFDQLLKLTGSLLEYHESLKTRLPTT